MKYRLKFKKKLGEQIVELQATNKQLEQTITGIQQTNNQVAIIAAAASNGSPSSKAKPSEVLWVCCFCTGDVGPHLIIMTGQV